MRTYSELIKLPTFDERLKYLLLGATIGAETFGVNRYLNQRFYATPEWRKFRSEIIRRDMGCDLAVPGMEIPDGSKIYIHHIEPIKQIDIERRKLEVLLNPENSITVCFDTHQAIHYGNIDLITKPLVERKPGDTKLW